MGDPGFLELGHEGDWVHGVSQVVEAGADGLALRNHTGDCRGNKRIDPVVAAILVNNLSGEGELTALRLAEYLGCCKSVHRKAVSTKHIAHEPDPNSLRQRKHRNQGCSRNCPKAGEVGIDEDVTVRELAAHFVQLWDRNQSEAAAADGLAQVYDAGRERHFGASALTPVKVTGAAKPGLMDKPNGVAQSIV